MTPFDRLTQWMEEARAAGQIEPEAMTLATAGLDGQPSARIVLFKGFSRAVEEAQAAGAEDLELEREGAPGTGATGSGGVFRDSSSDVGLRFFTNYESRKGRELAQNPRAALLFHWATLTRQVRIEGSVEKLSPEESDAYFYSRPHGSQVSAAVSPQSQPIESRDWLVQQRDALQAAHPEVVPRPAHWGGYRLLPMSFEFWKAGSDRLHERTLFRKAAGGAWTEQLLAP